jgi:hypothetical protein
VKHARGGGAVLRALAHVAAEKGGVRPHCGVEYHYYAGYGPGSTPNGAEAAENAGLGHRSRPHARTHVIALRVFNELHHKNATPHSHTIKTVSVQALEVQRVETVASLTAPVCLHA